MWLEKSKSRFLVVLKVCNIDCGGRLWNPQMRHNIGLNIHSNQVKPGGSGVKQISVDVLDVALHYRFVIWEKKAKFTGLSLYCSAELQVNV